MVSIGAIVSTIKRATEIFDCEKDLSCLQREEVFKLGVAAGYFLTKAPITNDIEIARAYSALQNLGELPENPEYLSFSALMKRLCDELALEGNNRKEAPYEAANRIKRKHSSHTLGIASNREGIEEDNRNIRLNMKNHASSENLVVKKWVNASNVFALSEDEGSPSDKMLSKNRATNVPLSGNRRSLGEKTGGLLPPINGNEKGYLSSDEGQSPRVFETPLKEKVSVFLREKNSRGQESVFKQALLKAQRLTNANGLKEPNKFTS